jgi:antirestriction protein ArdC
VEQKFDVYETITATIIEAIEAGINEFEMPWHALSTMPTNANTGLRYSGINVLTLWAIAAKYSYSTQLWATYRQWREMGAQVRRAQKSATVVFWKFYGGQKESIESDADEAAVADDQRIHCVARAYHVFNADQVNGFTVPVCPPIPESQRIAEAERFFKNTGARIFENGSRAYYDPKCDEIYMPPFAVFKHPDLFYSTLAHECVHFTGHKSRCNRQLANRFGSEAYALEELIAELGSAFLSAELNLETKPRFDNAPYVKNWLHVLRNDKRAIFTAASKAQQGVHWLMAAQDRAA